MPRLAAPAPHRRPSPIAMNPDQHPLDVDWLRDFVVLAETGNFSRAADARVIAQPALSRHIRALEDWAGVPLIDRSAHPVALTAAGQAFLPQVQSVLAALEAARIKAKAAHDQDSASLRFASTHALSLSFFPTWLAQLELRLRLGPVQTMSDSFAGCEDLMHQRRVQFMLCYRHPDLPNRLDAQDYPMRRLGEDRLLPVCAPDAQGRPLYGLPSAQPLPLLAYGEASALGRILAGAMARRQDPALQRWRACTPSVVFTAHNAFLLRAMALEGRGLAWLPQSLVQAELDSARLCLAGEPAEQLPLTICLYRQKAPMSAMAEALWGLLAPAAA